ncbi:HK97 family phage prohead protease [Flavobacterium aquiphilum]|uniref:HK97 family phage prohead protease n=1 Tax=Flavobacterium aquiphilum TaxID=3003261 RepID=UPI002480EF49|nr:HK97 family phage prohead protease [Flavobacterium aquiphilum]
MENKDYIQNISETAERRFFSSEVRMAKRDASVEDSPSVIEGYACKFNSETVIGNWFREKIRTGACDDVLNDDVRCLFNHNPNYILARCFKRKGTLTLSVDDIGLKYSYVTPDRQYARDLENAIEMGDVTQSSFAFDIEEQIWHEVDGELPLREIVRFKILYDVAPVTYPAYTDTEVVKRSLTAYQEKNKTTENAEPVEARSDNEKELNAFEAQLIINSNL